MKLLSPSKRISTCSRLAPVSRCCEDGLRVDIPIIDSHIGIAEVSLIIRYVATLPSGVIPLPLDSFKQRPWLRSVVGFRHTILTFAIRSFATRLPEPERLGFGQVKCGVRGFVVHPIQHSAVTK